MFKEILFEAVCYSVCSNMVQPVLNNACSICFSNDMKMSITGRTTRMLCISPPLVLVAVINYASEFVDQRLFNLIGINYTELEFHSIKGMGIIFCGFCFKISFLE